MRQKIVLHAMRRIDSNHVGIVCGNKIHPIPDTDIIINFQDCDEVTVQFNVVTTEISAPIQISGSKEKILGFLKNVGYYGED